MRARGEGTWRQRDGGYSLRIFVDGKRREFYGATKAECRRKHKAAQDAAEQGLVPIGAMTVRQFMMEWLETVRKNKAWNTYRQYRGLIVRHALPAIGDIKLAALETRHVERLLNDKQGAMSEKTRWHLRTTIGAALSYAVRLDYVSRNVVSRTTAVQVPKYEAATLNAEQAARLMHTAESEPLGALVILAVLTGMREGELLGLSWSDVDLEAGVISVRTGAKDGPNGTELGGLKTESSRRELPILDVGVKALRDRRRHQLVQQVAASRWTETGLVFTTSVGTVVSDRNMRDRFYHPLLKRAGVPRVRFHDLRHSSATLMLALGVPMFEVSRVLGHAKMATTSDRYGHLDLAGKRAALGRLDAALGGLAVPHSAPQ